MSDDTIELITVAEAISRPPDTATIHTFRQGGMTLIGADWECEDIIQALHEASEIQVTGENAQGMGHGIAIKDQHGWLFIQTRAAGEPQQATVNVDTVEI